ncbi:MAG: hypothetical protein GTN81_04275 [Proteobacteria bacterium]|nr:hypothetical protein [Pseudomonadota bacterium]
MSGRQGRIGERRGRIMRRDVRSIAKNVYGMTVRNSDNGKVTNPRVAVLPALLVQGVQIVYIYMISIPRIESLIVFAIGLTWLILLPGLGPVIYLTICQAINIYLASLVAANVPKDSLYIVIPLLSIFFSIVSIILMIRGLKVIRKQKR